MISLKTHNIIDYAAGAALVFSPFLFGFSNVDAARNVFMVSGFLLVMYSLFTNYYYAALRVLPLGAHMTLDALLGAALISAPWVFSYRGAITPGQQYLHYVLGVGVIVLVAFTAERTEAEKREHHVRLDPYALGVR